MKFALSIALAASAMLLPAAFAGSPQAGSASPGALAGPADPAATVPMPTYASIFRNYLPWKHAQEFPPKTWRAMNDGVAGAAASAQSGGGMAGMGEGGPASTSAHRHNDMQHEGK